MSMSPSGSLFADLPTELSEELFETILSLPGIRIERIISSGQATPDGEWYDQPQGEWVFLAAGSAGLLLQESWSRAVFAWGLSFSAAPLPSPGCLDRPGTAYNLAGSALYLLIKLKRQRRRGIRYPAPSLL